MHVKSDESQDGLRLDVTQGHLNLFKEGFTRQCLTPAKKRFGNDSYDQRSFFIEFVPLSSAIM